MPQVDRAALAVRESSARAAFLEEPSFRRAARMPERGARGKKEVVRVRVA
jgi:hypothetical protein